MESTKRTDPAAAGEAGPLLARAFQVDPMFDAVQPDPARRRKVLPWFFTAATRLGLDQGRGTPLPGRRGARPSGSRPTPDGTERDSAITPGADASSLRAGRLPALRADHDPSRAHSRRAGARAVLAPVHPGSGSRPPGAGSWRAADRAGAGAPRRRGRAAATWRRSRSATCPSTSATGSRRPVRARFPKRRGSGRCCASLSPGRARAAAPHRRRRRRRSTRASPARPRRVRAAPRRRPRPPRPRRPRRWAA